MTKHKTIITLLLLIGIIAAGSALADDPCKHPTFVTHECLDSTLSNYEGADGKDGKDGLDGKDGKDGRDGIDGKDGRDGIDGKDGRDGIVPDYWNKEISRFIAASDAIHLFLPQDETSRVTFGVSRINSETGLGIGYAYRCHDCERDVALTIGLGTSRGETTGKASIGWEF